MKKIVSATMFALTIAALPALARTNSLNITDPSAQNSGAGIPGLPGTEDGPAVQPATVGASAATSQEDLTVREQDAVSIPGLPGSEDGPAVKALSG